ncbi:MAG: C39 family peptidase [Elusimicrobia bacterium]|nr:C39 family peptidase [Elusimicrobiota bacterium]
MTGRLLFALSLAAVLGAGAAAQTVRENAQKAFDELDREAGEQSPPPAARKPEPSRPARVKPAEPPKPESPAKPKPPAAPEAPVKSEPPAKTQPAVKPPAQAAPAAAAAPPEISTSAAAANPGVEFVSRLRAKGNLAAGTESRLSLADGASLTVPAGALDVSVEGSLERLDAASAAEDFLRVYDVRLGGASLRKKASLVLPLEGDAPLGEVLHYDEARKRWEPVPAALSADKKSVALALDRFSPVAISQPGRLGKEPAAASASGKKAGPLEVPYYHQGSTMWCWAAAMSMLEGYYGRMTKIWEPAAHFQMGPHEGLYLPAPRLSAYLREKCPACAAEYKIFYLQSSLDAYVRSQLDQGRPVWVDLTSAVHAVVAVGYDADDIYVHDPSGALIAQTRGIRALDSAYQAWGAGALKGINLGAYAIAWDKWDFSVWDAIRRNLAMPDDKVHWQWGHLNPVRLLVPSVYAVSLSAPAGARKPLSLTLFPAEESPASFGVAHSARDNAAKLDVGFHWDGRAPGGTAFRHVGDPHRAGMLCNGDSIEFVRPFVSNTSDHNLPAELTVLLDGRAVARKALTLERRLVHVPVMIPDTEFLQPVRFLEAPVPLGPHELAFELASGGKTMDRAALAVTVAPEQVAGVKVREDAAGEATVSWDANAEEKMPDADIVYRVFRTPRMDRNFGKRLGETEPGQHRLKIKAEDKLKGQYYTVWAHDRKTGLGSQYAVYRQIEKDAPAGPEEWTLVETSFEVWDGKTMEDGQRAFSAGRSALTPSKLSSWKIDENEFSFFNSSSQFKISARWDAMPKSVTLGKSFPFALEASIDGPQSANIGFTPVGPMCEWDIALKNADPAVKSLSLGLQKCDGAVPPRVFRIDLAGGKDKPKVQSAKMEFALTVRKTHYTSKSGPGETAPLFLEVNCGNLAKIHWAFQKASPAPAAKPQN